MAKNFEVGKRYRFSWPKGKPSFRMVGTLTDIRHEKHTTWAAVQYDKSKKPHWVLIESSTSVKAKDDEQSGWFIANRISTPAAATEGR